jgi:hypothetical protein
LRGAAVKRLIIQRMLGLIEPGVCISRKRDGRHSLDVKMYGDACVDPHNGADTVHPYPL